MSNPVYRPPHSRNPSWASSLDKRTNRSNNKHTLTRDTVDMTNTDAFPELLNNSKQKQFPEQNVPSFLKTIEKTETNTDDEDTISANNSSSSSLKNGWIEITKDTCRQWKTSEQRREDKVLKYEKDPFIYRMICKDRYIHSLNDQQYAILANETMKKVADIYRRQASEFIDMHGYEYYDHIYGYTPVYGKRVIRRPRSNSSEDITSLLGTYNEYYTDDETNNDEEYQEDEEFDEY